MKSQLLINKVILILLLAFSPIELALSQTTGTSPQSGTSSQVQTQAQTPAPGVGETQTAPPQPGIGNTAPAEASRGARWGWLILGFFIGLFVGALAWRRPAAVVRREERRDRIA